MEIAGNQNLQDLKICKP